MNRYSRAAIVAAMREQRMDDAAAALRARLQRDRSDSWALHYLGVMAFTDGRYPVAAALLNLATEHGAQSPVFRSNIRGFEMIRPGLLSEFGSVALFHAAQEENRCGRTMEAYQTVRWACRSAPAEGGYWSLRGIFAKALGFDDDALAALGRGAELDPNHGTTLSHLATLLYARGEVGQALAHAERALAVDPNFAPARFTLALCQLHQGEFEAGWRNFEARWDCEQVQDALLIPPKTPVPRWQGQPLDGKTLWVKAEQGLGDVLMFARYLPELRSRGARVVLETQSVLVSLMQASGIAERVIPRNAAEPSADYWLPMMSLPGALNYTFPHGDTWQLPYLRQVTDRLTQWHERFPATTVRRVGICWGGRLRGDRSDRRTVSVTQLEPLAEVPGIQWLSLQVGARELPQTLPGFVDTGAQLRDFADTAALIGQLDLVITVDTSVAHLAGALGAPTWCLIPFGCDWRWSGTGSHSPWYPGMVLFRQDVGAQWEPVLQRVVQALRRWVINEEGSR